MNEYIFLFVLAGVWLVFATIHDFKKKEIPNWGNFSLIAIALAYRSFYSVLSGNFGFLVFGLVGLGAFVILGYILYYGKVFAGGDAKLLMALGPILPFTNLIEVLVLGVWFVFLLFFAGSIYGFIYSLILIKMKKNFNKEFGKIIGKNKLAVFLPLILSFLLALVSLFVGLYYVVIGFVLIGISPLLYYFARTVDNVCMVEFVSPGKLTEGDWLVENVKVKNKVIKKSVHGLSMKNIKILRKYNKKIKIRSGIPFAISFLIGFMVFVVLFFLKIDFYFLL